MIPRSEYIRDYPDIKGLSEIHIFLLPLNPDDETIANYEKAVADYNKEALKPGANFQMKACVLCLNFRELGDVTVLQSSRYFYSNDEQEVIKQTYFDGEWFIARGFTLLRHKIECITTAKGVPQSGDEWKTHPKRYFEFHIRVCPIDKTESAQITETEVEELKQIAKNYTDAYKTPVPLSYNKSAKAHQRYLNVRFSNCSADYACDVVDQIRKTIEASPKLSYVKTISEYVWYDDHRAVDNGWIDFTDEEKRDLLG